MKTHSNEYVKDSWQINDKLACVESKKPFPEALKALMKEKEISYARLSGATRTADFGGKGLSQGYIHNLATKVRTPTPQNMEILAKALRVDPKYFREYREYVVAQEAKILAATYGFDTIMEKLREVGQQPLSRPPKKNS